MLFSSSCVCLSVWQCPSLSVFQCTAPTLTRMTAPSIVSQCCAFLFSLYVCVCECTARTNTRMFLPALSVLLVIAMLFASVCLSVCLSVYCPNNDKDVCARHKSIVGHCYAFCLCLSICLSALCTVPTMTGTTVHLSACLFLCVVSTLLFHQSKKSFCIHQCLNVVALKALWTTMVQP